MPDLTLIILATDMTDDELKASMVSYNTIVTATKRGAYVTVSGYDHDTRELFEIPEVVEFFQRLVQLGFISLLAIDTREAEVLDAFHVWGIANGTINSKTAEIEKAVFEQFFREVAESNARCDAVCRATDAAHVYGKRF